MSPTASIRNARTRAAPLLALLLLGIADVARAADPVPADTGNAAHDMLARMTPAERNRTLDRVLHSVDRADCDVVQSTFIEYRSGAYATWRANCKDGRRYLLDLKDGSDSTVTVISCNGSPERQARCEP